MQQNTDSILPGFLLLVLFEPGLHDKTVSTHVRPIDQVRKNAAENTENHNCSAKSNEIEGRPGNLVSCNAIVSPIVTMSRDAHTNKQSAILLDRQLHFWLAVNFLSQDTQQLQSLIIILFFLVFWFFSFL